MLLCARHCTRCSGYTEKTRKTRFFIETYNFLPFFFFKGRTRSLGGSQARGRIGTVAAGLCHGYSNARFQPNLQPTPQLIAMPDPHGSQSGSVSLSHDGNYYLECQMQDVQPLGGLQAIEGTAFKNGITVLIKEIPLESLAPSTMWEQNPEACL